MSNQEQIKTKIKQILSEVKELVDQGLINRGQILAIFEEEKPGPSRAPQLTFQQLLYFIGGFIVILGTGIFVGQFWDNWNQIVKVAFSLGLSSALYVIGHYFHYNRPNLAIFSHVSFILSALLLPLGVGTSLDLLGISAITKAGMSLNFALLFIIYFPSYWILKEDIFFVSAVVAASGLFINFTDFLIGKASPRYFEYQLLLLGAVYLTVGYYYKGLKRYIVDLLHFFGLSFFLGAAFALSLDSWFWFFIFPLMLAATFYASVALQNTLILTLATIFTFMEIGRITAEYFSGSLGWPIALITAGFSIILVGYFSFEVRKKYITAEKKM